MAPPPESPGPRDPRDPQDPADRQPARDDDALWRAIVENYGERAVLDDAPGDPTGRSARAPRPSADREPVRPPPAPETPVPPALRDLDGPAPRQPHDEDEHFVPPPPPPVPRATPPRLLAWVGLFGAPVLLLVALVLGVVVPSWAGLLLTVWFVGGFVYLVASMRPGPRDEDDDGAVL